MCLRMTAVM
nr:Chain C, Ceramide synthase 5 [Mus musculus]5E8N_F Chain F, Ceramide synthase 5 [Mus musculus]5E8N_I Chain I, Ceramide synthase 5 [Mus musculus]5E8N_L Chain L, Ceramide synthase 5 [Mus musculus]